MTQRHNTNPIGIFDSGIGGLTVARAVHDLLPHENLIYFGDLAHLPYGDKSVAAIQAYAIKICNFLLSQKVKVILIACNTAATAAYELLKEYVGSRAKVMSVIEPTVAYIKEQYAGQKVGLIGTKRTVSSNAYKKKIDDLHSGIQLQSLATPLLVPMIEEGFIKNQISESIIHNYLSDKTIQDIQSLILGCTHYPLIKEEISAYYQHKVEIIDSSLIVASSLEKLLIEEGLKNTEAGTGIAKFYVSDYTQAFEDTARFFFGKEIHLEHYPLWE